MKLCRKCGEVKDEGQFNRTKRSKDGLQQWCKICKKQYNQEHLDEQAKYDAQHEPQYRRVHKQEKTEYMRQYGLNYRLKNRENISRYAAKYVREHLLEHRVRNSKRRARLKGNGGSHTFEDILNLYTEQEGKCKYCRESIENYFEIDHIVPISRAGVDSPENLVLACKKCNRSKFNKTIEEWGK